MHAGCFFFVPLCMCFCGCRKVTAQKMKTASATGVLALQEHGLKEVPADVFQLVNLRVRENIMIFVTQDGLG